MSEGASNVERLVELLAERMDRDLVANENAELRALLAENPEWQEDDLEITAAAIDMAFGGPEDVAVPDGLVGRILDDADHFFEDAAPVIRLADARRERGAGWAAWSGWAVAAAALLVVWLQGTPDARAPAATAAERAAALADQPGTMQLAWSRTEDPLAAGVRGDVLWSGNAQEGYMRFQGLAANDPSKNQYQLWIFDAERNEAHPVDGGVFDSDGGEVVVPIDPRVPVTDATVFAVTLERPGGVVVSTRERLVLVAKPG